jgi:NLP/P60 protein
MEFKKILALSLSIMILTPNLANASALNKVEDMQNNQSDLKVFTDVLLQDKDEDITNLIKETNEHLEKGHVFKAGPLVSKIRNYYTDNKELLKEEDQKEIENIILKYDRIYKKKEELQSLYDKMKEENYDEALKTYENIDFMDNENIYQKEITLMEIILNSKKEDKATLDELKSLQDIIFEMKDPNEANQIINDFDRKLVNEEQIAEYNKIIEYIEDLKFRIRLQEDMDNLEARLDNPQPDYVTTYTYDTGLSQDAMTYSIDANRFPEMIKAAYNALGTPYIWGGMSYSGWDCSGFVSRMYADYLGIRLNRVAQDQSYQGREVSDLLPGDLVFFGSSRSNITHVGMYVGDGNFIHAANPQKGTRIDSLNAPWYQNRLQVVKRIVE